MEILGYHITEFQVVTSDGDICKANLLEFLLLPRINTIRMLYSVDYSLPNLADLVHLSVEEQHFLVETTKLSVPPYHLRYLPGKLLSVKRQGAFSFYADSQQYHKYPDTDMEMLPSSLAKRARETGRRVYQVLEELGIEATSLTSPARAYEKSQISKLYKEKVSSSDDKVRCHIIDGIGEGVFGDRWTKYLQAHVQVYIR